MTSDSISSDIRTDVGPGTSCGATDLNRRFAQQVKDRLSEEREQLEALPNSVSFEETLRDLEIIFEDQLKSSYDGGKQFEELLRVPGLSPNESKGFQRSTMEINR